MGAAKNIEIRVTVHVTGLASLQQLAQAMSQISAAQKSMTTTVAGLQKAMQKQQQTVKKQTQAVQGLSNSFKRFTQDMTHNIYKVLEWGLATGVIYGSIRALREALLDVGDVDFAIAGLTKVMDEAGGRSRRLARDVQVLASQYGEMGDVLINATTEWARLQGSNLEIMQGTTAALLAQAVAEMEVTDATRLLIAELKQFEQPLLNSVRLIDQWNELSNTFAVRAVDIAQSAARAGGVMHNMGVEMERLHGYTTALVQSTGRAGEAIGTALRTIATYSYRVETMNNLSKLANINITDLTETQMGLSQILDQVAMNWGTYTDANQKAIAQTMAGTRRVNEFITLMEQYPVALEATIRAWRSVGSAQKEAAIFLDTVRKQLDRTRSLMQRLVTESGNLANVFKLAVVQLNFFIRGLIALKPLIIAAVAGLVAYRIAAYLAIVPLKYLYFQLIDLVKIHHPLLVALTAVGVAMATVATITGYLADRKERAIQAAKDLADKSYAEARALRAEADQLSFLTNAYEAHISALQRAAAQPGIFSQQQVDRMVDNANKLGKELERVTGVPFEPINMKTTKWADSLDKVRQKFEEIDSAATKAFEEQKVALAAQLDSQKRELDFWELLSKKLAERGRLSALLVSDAQLVKKALDESGMSADQLGISFHVPLIGAEKMNITLGEVPDKIKSANAEWGKTKQRLDEINEGVYKLGGILSDIDREKALENLANRLDKIGAYWDYVAARSKFANESQTKMAKDGMKSIDDQIKTVKELADRYKEDEKIQKEANKLLIGLYKERRQQIYAIMEAGWIDSEKELNDEFKRTIANLNAQTSYMVKYAQQTRGNVAASEIRLQQMQKSIVLYEQEIEKYKEREWATEDLKDKLEELNRDFEEEKMILENLLRPLEQYDDAIERINAATAKANMLLQARGASELKIAKMELAAAAHRKALAATPLEAKAAENALQLARAREEAATISDKYTKATEQISFALQKDMAIMQASGAASINMARRRLQAAREEIKATSEMEEGVRKLAEQKEALARIDLAAAVVMKRRTDLANKHQLALANISMAQEQQISSLELLGVTDVKVAEAQVAHAREVFDAVRMNQKAYSSLVDWAMATLDALRNLRSSQAALDKARMDRVRSQIREEYELLQGKHDFEIDLMDAMGRTTREQVEARIAQLGREFEFVVTNTKLTSDQRRDMAQALYRNLLDMSRQYEIDEIDRARDIAEAYVQQFKRVEDQWVATVREMATGSPLQAILRAMDRIFADWFEEMVRDRWGGFIKKMTGIEIGLTGKSREELRAEEESRQKMVDAMIEGGDYVEASIRRGFEGVGQQIQDYLKTGKAIGGDGGDLLGTQNFVEQIESSFSRSVNWLKAAGTSVAVGFGKAIRDGGKDAGKEMKESIQEAGEETAKKMSGMDKAMTAYGLLRGADVRDWTQERGGGWRAAGFTAGAVIGSFTPVGPVVGAMIGQEVVSIGQDIKDWLSKETTVPTPTRTESLREQLSNTISRGQFREAAQITYNVQNTVMMDFFIPDAAQMKRAIPIIKVGLEDYGNNVSVGR